MDAFCIHLKNVQLSESTAIHLATLRTADLQMYSYSYSMPQKYCLQKSSGFVFSFVYSFAGICLAWRC